MSCARKFLVLALAVPLALMVSGAQPKPAPGSSNGSYTITIKDFEFTPRNLVISAGSKVTWVNKDEEPHKIAEANSAFGSQPLDTDEGFTYEFKAAGTYEYFCTLHPRMTGKIVVESK